MRLERTPKRPADRLQPALLDRLTQAPGAAQDGATMDRAQLKRAVLRDLAWLLNAVQPMGRDEAQAHPRAAASVLNFGLAPLAGERASDIDAATLEASIREAILRFEPRILADGLEVHALEPGSALDTHNIVELEIHARLWAQPVPLELLLRTRLDLEGGQVQVQEATRSARAAGRF